jgi:hypothetical protein
MSIGYIKLFFNFTSIKAVVKLQTGSAERLP